MVPVLVLWQSRHVDYKQAVEHFLSAAVIENPYSQKLAGDSEHFAAST